MVAVVFTILIQGFWFLILPILLYRIMRRLRFPRIIGATLIAVLFVYYLYQLYTDPHERNYDGSAQLEYIRFIADHGYLPPSDGCWICHHPPLYYIVAGVVRYLAAFMKYDLFIERSIQSVSLFSMLVFIIYGLRSVRLFHKGALPLFSSLLLLALWPYSIVNSVRVHNDILFYALFSVFLFHFLRYYRTRKESDRAFASVSVALGLLTKSSAIIGALLFYLMEVYLFLRERKKKRSTTRRRLVFLLLPVLSLLLVQLVINPLRNNQNTKATGILGSAYNVNQSHFVNNGPSAYLTMNLKSYFTEPFVIAKYDGFGRNHYWNHLLKSSLFGTHNHGPDFETSYRIHIEIAMIVSILLIGFVVGSLAGSVTYGKKSALVYRPVLLTVLLFLSSHMVFKMMIPAPHHNDFRLIYPVMIPLSILYFRAPGMVGRGKVGGFAGKVLPVFFYGLTFVFVFLSLVYYIPFSRYIPILNPRKIQVEMGDLQTPRKEKTPWNKPGNVVLHPHEYAEVHMDAPMDVAGFDISFDNNDEYLIRLQSADETTLLEKRVGPEKKIKKGLAVQRVRLDKTIKDVHKIIIRPVSGDNKYSIGHFILLKKEDYPDADSGAGES